MRVDVTQETEPTPEVLFKNHYARLVRGLAVGSGSADDAADAVQEAFIELCLRWERIRSYEDPVGWVRRVAVNRLIKRNRSLRRRTVAIQQMARPVSFHPQDEAAGSLDLAKAMKSLPGQQRLAVALHYVSGLTVAETADAMGISKGTADTHLHRARQALRPTLEVDR